MAHTACRAFFIQKPGSPDIDPSVRMVNNMKPMNVIEAQHQKGDSKKTVFLSPTQQKLDAFLDFPTPSCKKDVQSIMGAAAQLKRWTPGLILLTGNSTPFFWNDDLQKELDGMKATLKEHVKLMPLDTSNDLLVWSDAAPSDGMCYVLAQWTQRTRSLG